MSAIVRSSREQSTGIKEISEAVNNIDQATQKNAAMVEEQTAASHSLASEADELSRLVSQFRTAKANQSLGTSKHTVVASVSEHQAVPSAARALARKVAGAFGHGKGAGSGLAHAVKADWEEF